MDVYTLFLYLVAFVSIGWALNLFVTFLSFCVDLYHAAPDMSRGLLACLAFSWVPYFVFVSGLLHFMRWLIEGENAG